MITTSCSFLAWLIFRPDGGGDMFFRNAGWLWTFCMALYPRRQESSKKKVSVSYPTETGKWFDQLFISRLYFKSLHYETSNLRWFESDEIEYLLEKAGTACDGFVAVVVTKPRQTSGKMTSSQAEIWTRSLQNINQWHQWQRLYAPPSPPYKRPLLKSVSIQRPIFRTNCSRKMLQAPLCQNTVHHAVSPHSTPAQSVGDK